MISRRNSLALIAAFATGFSGPARAKLTQEQYELWQKMRTQFYNSILAHMDSSTELHWLHDGTPSIDILLNDFEILLSYYETNWTNFDASQLLLIHDDDLGLMYALADAIEKSDATSSKQKSSAAKLKSRIHILAVKIREALLKAGKTAKAFEKEIDKYKDPSPYIEKRLRAR